MVTENKPRYKVIGTRPVRPDGVDKVTGRAQYGAFPGSAAMYATMVAAASYDLDRRLHFWHAG